jgi:predicted kinase
MQASELLAAFEGGGRESKMKCKGSPPGTPHGGLDATLQHSVEKPVKIALVHLSDIHLRQERSNPALGWTEAVAAAVAPEVSECVGVVLALTGDVAFAGKTKEYQLADRLLDELTTALAERNVKVIATTVVPGNHDCDFAMGGGVRQALIGGDDLKAPDIDIVKACTAIQAPFAEFSKSRSLRHVGPGALVVPVDIKVNDETIRFLLCNSAWMSSLRERPGTLRAPLDYLRSECDHLDGSTPALVVWMMHHPYPWFDPDESRALRRFIEEVSDVVLTGHEHDGAAYTRSYRTGLQVDYVEGGVLQEGEDSMKSSFNTVVVDLGAGVLRVIQFERDKDIYVSSGGENWQKFVRNASRMVRLYEHDDAFRSTLDDAGAAFTHPRQAKLKLRDVFVYPDVRTLPITGTSRPGEVIRNLVAYISERRTVVLIGAEKSGKSTIAKRLCVDLRTTDVMPLLANGADFSPKDHVQLRRLVRDLIELQYGRQSIEPLMQLHSKHRALIIDDYHSVRLTRQGRAQLLRSLTTYFGVVVLMASEDLRLEYLAQDPHSVREHPIFEFAHAEILQLGHVRRHEMISKWYWLGRDRLETDDAVVHREILHAENLLTGAIGRNLLPSYPIFVLILLQQLETGRTHDTGAGSQGYLYQGLILASLSRIAPHPHDIDSRFNYLTELSWHLSREDGPDRINRDGLRRWHQQYCERHLVAFDHPKFVDDLLSVGILREDNGWVEFSYPYIQFFFVARYLKAHLHENEVRSLVREHASNLHDEETATVMVFLAHLSSDPFVLDTMVQAAMGLFNEYEEWNTTEQTQYLNTLIRETPKLALLRRSLEENRLSELQEFDEQELADVDEELRGAIDEQEESAFEEEIGPMLRINSAFKTIQIIGQVLRNYPGSLDGPRKVQLAEVCYRLGLRILGFVFGSIEAHGEQFIKGLIEHVVRLRPEAGAERITTDANAFLFALCERSSFGVIRHISQSLGHHELAPVFREIEKLGDGQTSFRLIDLSIRLDHSRQPPAAEAIRLYTDERDNTIVATLVRHLVWYHLYLFPTDFRVRQQLCARLDIDDQPRHLIQQDTKLVTSRARTPKRTMKTRREKRK